MGALNDALRGDTVVTTGNCRPDVDEGLLDFPRKTCLTDGLSRGCEYRVREIDGGVCRVGLQERRHADGLIYDPRAGRGRRTAREAG